MRPCAEAFVDALGPRAYRRPLQVEERGATLALYDDREAVGILILKAKDYSTTQVSERVREKLEELEPTLPEGAHLEIIQDSGVRVEASVHNVQQMLIEGAILTVLVVFLFLNSWRSTVITGLALLGRAVMGWRAVSFGALDYAASLRVVIPGTTLALLGVQLILASFFLSVLGMQRRVAGSVAVVSAEGLVQNQ